MLALAHNTKPQAQPSPTLFPRCNSYLNKICISYISTVSIGYTPCASNYVPDTHPPHPLDITHVYIFMKTYAFHHDFIHTILLLTYTLFTSLFNMCIWYTNHTYHTTLRIMNIYTLFNEIICTRVHFIPTSFHEPAYVFPVIRRSNVITSNTSYHQSIERSVIAMPDIGA